jgi:hypothetical protein
MPLSDACKRVTMGERPRKLVRVIKREEKGSDVNLASALLMDAFQNKFEQAVLITNDSDLNTPLTIVRDLFKFPIGVINPHEYHSKKLKKNATFLARIRPSDLQAAQFPETLIDARGEFYKPPKWSEPLEPPRILFSFLRGGKYRLR